VGDTEGGVVGTSDGCTVGALLVGVAEGVTLGAAVVGADEGTPVVGI
jgi:hypothetical protein